MKRIPVLLALIAVLALTVWIGGAEPAYAMPTCSELRGDPCVPPAQYNCWTDTGQIGVCTCLTLPGSSPRWFCTG